MRGRETEMRQTLDVLLATPCGKADDTGLAPFTQAFAEAIHAFGRCEIVIQAGEKETLMGGPKDSASQARAEGLRLNQWGLRMLADAGAVLPVAKAGKGAPSADLRLAMDVAVPLAVAPASTRKLGTDTRVPIAHASISRKTWDFPTPLGPTSRVIPGTSRMRGAASAVGPARNVMRVSQGRRGLGTIGAAASDRAGQTAFASIYSSPRRAAGQAGCAAAAPWREVQLLPRKITVSAGGSSVAVPVRSRALWLRVAAGSGRPRSRFPRL